MFTFETNVEGIQWTLYMGKDKYENDILLDLSSDYDIWFHVDNLSSAHVYVQTRPGYGISNLPKELLQQCSQLTKENSIEGCKAPKVTIVYTLRKNLDKVAGDTGKVTFRNMSEVKYVHNVRKDSDSLRKLRSIKTERSPQWLKKKKSIKNIVMSDVPKILPKKTTLHEDTLEDLFRAPREESNPYNSEITYREYESDFM